MRIIFLGTPDFAVPSLIEISKHHEVIAVITQMDKERGRGHEKSFSPVKKTAKELGLDVLQYKKLRVDAVEDLKRLAPDLMVTCAYGQILSQEIIDIPKLGIINIHASLLPLYRGASPITWSVVNGDKKTGVTLMKTEAGIDTGDILMMEEVEISEDATAGEMFDILSVLGSKMIVEGLKSIEDGTAVFTPQDHERATHVKMFTKEAGLIDFSKSALEVKNHIRGMNPYPMAYFMLNDTRIKVFKANIFDGEIDSSFEAGQVVISSPKQGLVIKCGEGAVEIETLQFPNAKVVSAKDALNGRKIEVGTQI